MFLLWRRAKLLMDLLDDETINLWFVGEILAALLNPRKLFHGKHERIQINAD